MSENDLLCNLGLHKLPQVEGLVCLLGDHFEFLLLVWQLEGCSTQDRIRYVTDTINNRSCRNLIC
jgi:hypothetical protein